MNNEIARYSEETFESIKHVDEYGYEFWYARELRRVFNTHNGVASPMLLSGQSWLAATADTALPNILPTSANHRRCPRRSPHSGRLQAFPLCLLPDRYEWRPAQGGHGNLGQTYFAVKTRQQEFIDHYDELSEDQKRLAIRKEMKAHQQVPGRSGAKGWRYQVL